MCSSDLVRTGTLPLILLAVIVVIISLAYACPTDPTWIAGIYDVADDDEMVGSVTDTNSAVAVQPTVAGQPSSTVVARLAPSFGTVSDIGVLLAFCFRSPPERLNRQFECDWVGWRIWQRSVQGSRPDGAFVFLESPPPSAARIAARGVGVFSPHPKVATSGKVYDFAVD